MKTIEKREEMVSEIRWASKYMLTMEKVRELENDVANVDFEFNAKHPEQSGVFRNGKRLSGPY